VKGERRRVRGVRNSETPFTVNILPFPFFRVAKIQYFTEKTKKSFKNVRNTRYKNFYWFKTFFENTHIVFRKSNTETGKKKPNGYFFLKIYFDYQMFNFEKDKRISFGYIFDRLIFFI
jgi:hypothetical protein